MSPLPGAGPDLMLGVDETAERAEHLRELPPGAVVLLYTDGLIERRGSSLDAGLELLCRHLRDLVQLPVEELADEVLDRMLPETPSDDVALVVVRLARDGSRPCRAARR